MRRKFALLILNFVVVSLTLAFFPNKASAGCIHPPGNIIIGYHCTSRYHRACSDPLTSRSWCCDDNTECRADGEVWCETAGTVRTAIGCISASDPKDLINQVVTWSLRIAAGASLITILYSGFLFLTSSGDVKRVNEAKTFLMSSLLGLALISLAVLIINFIGVRIFGLNTIGFSV